MSEEGVAVVALGAWCEIDPRQEELRAFGDESTPSASFRVLEFAVLEDGRRVTIRDDLGFGVSTRQPRPWHWLTREFVEHDIRTNVVVPDETDFVDGHPYGYLVDLLRRQGIETSEAHLRSLPYTVEFPDDFDRRLEEIARG